MSEFDDSALSCNDFLGGQLRLWQPKDGYRAGVDPVLLAASVPARSGQRILELGCGAGQVLLCLGARVPGVDLTGVELQSSYAQLARRNGTENKIAIKVVEGDLVGLPDDLRQRQFDHVLANPPYYARGAHSSSANLGRATALGEQTPLAQWIEVAARRLAPQGFLHMIQRVDRLPEMLMACDSRLGSIEVLPLAARVGRAPELLILRARKSGRAAFRLHAPLILHEGDRHEADGDSYRPCIANILRKGAALDWPRSR